MASHKDNDDDELPHKVINNAQLALLFSKKAEKYTDAKVTCKGIEWKVQQSILCMRCPFFEACFRAGTFQEGEDKTVDFKDDEPHAVEALLIYLYTLEYPNRKSDKFEEPALGASTSVSVEAAAEEPREVGYEKQGHSFDSDYSKEPVANVARFKLKSQTPESMWQERIALYRIAHRLGLRKLCKTTLEILIHEVGDSLRSSDAAQFIIEVYSLSQDEAQRLKAEVAKNVVDQDLSLVSRPTLDAITLSQPAFACDLIDVMQKKDIDRLFAIWERQDVIHQRDKEIADYKQGVQSIHHKETLEMHKAVLDKQKRSTREAKMKATELRKELLERKRALKEQKAKTAEQKKEISQPKKRVVDLEQASGASQRLAATDV